MIKNERDYAVTRQQADKFATAIRRLEAGEEQHVEVSPRLRKAEIDGLKSIHDELEEELNEYEALKSGIVHHFHANSLADLPQTLIKARIARGWTQKQLGERLGLREQQIQRYEANDYETISFSRLVEVAQVLGLQGAGLEFELAA